MMKNREARAFIEKKKHEKKWICQREQKPNRKHNHVNIVHHCTRDTSTHSHFRLLFFLK